MLVRDTQHWTRLKKLGIDEREREIERDQYSGAKNRRSRNEIEAKQRILFAL